MKATATTNKNSNGEYKCFRDKVRGMDPIKLRSVMNKLVPGIDWKGASIEEMAEAWAERHEDRSLIGWCMRGKNVPEMDDLHAELEAREML